jgi:ElaB/YqjD/DUF883 family membrane-anchored ribosome-binding protein
MNQTTFADTPMSLPDALKAPVADGAATAAAMARRSWDAVRSTSHDVAEHARHASDSTVSYIRDEPVKSVLIAAACGALIATLLGLIVRQRG